MFPPVIENERLHGRRQTYTTYIPPFKVVCKNCCILILGGHKDGRPYSELLQKSYQSFITSVEGLDNAMGKGMRGKKGVDMLPS